MTLKQPSHEVLEQLQAEDRLQDAVYRFNTSPEEGISDLISVCGSDGTPYSVADLLKTVPGLLPEVIGEFLSSRDHAEVTIAFFHTMNLEGSMTQAMHTALSSTLKLPAEGDAIDRIMQIFALCYTVQNPTVFPSTDAAHIMAFALLLLNSDLHNPKQKAKMSANQFIFNIRGALDPDVMSDAQLERMFNEIRDHPIVLSGGDDNVMALSAPKLKGKLKKKCNGCMASWKEHFFVLANSCLYYFASRHHESPLGMVQLVEVDAVMTKPKEIQIFSKTGHLQYVEFKKGGPVALTNIVWIKLVAPNVESGNKWFYRIKQSIIIVNFSSTPNTMGAIGLEEGEEISDAGGGNDE